jgi:hypothetical protein
MSDELEIPLEQVIWFSSSEMAVDFNGVRENLRYWIAFQISNPVEYFKAEASSLTLDTDHILFEP